MAALIAFAAIGLFAAGVVAGIIGVVSLAIRREERNFTLTSEAPAGQPGTSGTSAPGWPHWPASARALVRLRDDRVRGRAAATNQL